MVPEGGRGLGLVVNFNGRGVRIGKPMISQRSVPILMGLYMVAEQACQVPCGALYNFHVEINDGMARL